MKNLVQSKMFKAALVIAVALAFIMPSSAAIINNERSENVPLSIIPDFQTNDPQPLSPPFILEGECWYDQAKTSPVNDVDVIVINIDTGESFDAEETANAYYLELTAYDDVDVGETLRYFATDTGHYINVTDHVVTQSDLDNGGITKDLILDEYYTDLTDFPYYPSEDWSSTGNTFEQMTGPACIEMALDYMYWNTTTDPGDTAPRYTQNNIGDQKVIYDSIDQKTGGFVNARGLQQYLQANRPLPYGDYGYNFNIKFTGCPWNENWTQDSILGAICIWTDYSTSYALDYDSENKQTVADPYGEDDKPLKPGHQPHVPAFIPAFGGYDRWMAVRGIHTDTEPWVFEHPHAAAMDEIEANSQANAINVLGFWVNDPLPSGIGENTYKTGTEFKNTYFVPLSATGDAYDGEYVAVVEPPVDFQEQAVPQTNIVSWPELYSTNPMTGQTAVNFYSTVVGSIKVVNAAVQAMGKLVTLNDGLKTVYEESYAQLPIYVENLHDGDDYYIVNFGPTQANWIPRGTTNADEVSIVALVDADTCQFKELSYVDTPVDYLSIRQGDALDIVIDYLGGDIDPRSCETSLVYRGHSQFTIDVQVVTPEGVYYVNQDGEVSC